MSKSYVDAEALVSWKTEMEKINDACIDNIDNITKTMNSLNSSSQGDYADRFEENFGNYIKKVKESHEALKNVESFLTDVVEVMQSH